MKKILLSFSLAIIVFNRNLQAPNLLISSPLPQSIRPQSIGPQSIGNNLDVSTQAAALTTSQSTQKCDNDKCSFHWVFAMDSSGSMSGSKWQNLRGLLEDISTHLKNIGNQKMTVYTFNSKATVPPEQYLEFSNPQQWEKAKSKLPSNSGGGTDFGQPLIRGIQFILLHREINTCFVLLTDGEASYPKFQIELFTYTQKHVKSLGYQFCSICYFIKASQNSEPPKAFTDLCASIGARSIDADGNYATQTFTTNSDGVVVASAPIAYKAADSGSYRQAFVNDFAQQASLQIQAISP